MRPAQLRDAAGHGSNERRSAGCALARLGELGFPSIEQRAGGGFVVFFTGKRTAGPDAQTPIRIPPFIKVDVCCLLPARGNLVAHPWSRSVAPGRWRRGRAQLGAGAGGLGAEEQQVRRPGASRRREGEGAAEQPAHGPGVDKHGPDGTVRRREEERAAEQQARGHVADEQGRDVIVRRCEDERAAEQQARGRARPRRHSAPARVRACGGAAEARTSMGPTA
ncbi:hypothetical protein BRADI_4g21515v3 [Brachypodium distachyon]|uniref:Uncharacterized protein n=1 Tax=Brachypodium distachyon TaxID=15368 RepID=A0A0Q3EMU2_BRADI|nr:hypothetical protein BRADI_4g21515v3 [Brachypodium distachyon]